MRRSTLLLFTGCLVGVSCAAPRNSPPPPLEDLGAPATSRDVVVVAGPEAEPRPPRGRDCGSASSGADADLDEWRLALRDQWAQRLAQIVEEGPRRDRAGATVGRLTVLVPVDGAFAALSDDQVAAQLMDRGAFNAAVWLHVVDGDLWFVDGAWTQPTRGGSVEVQVAGPSVCVAGARVVGDPVVDDDRGVTVLPVGGLVSPSR